MADQLYISRLNPVQLVPEDPAQDARFHLKQMDKYFYVEQTTGWISKKNYYAPWQQDDTVELQAITDGNTSLQAIILDCDGVPVDVKAFSVIATSALQSPNVLLQVSIPLMAYTGVHYIKVTDGGTKFFISEGLNIQSDQPGTFLFQYWHDQNKLGTVFSEGYKPTMRVPCILSEFLPESRFVVYEDEPANIELLNGISYRRYRLNIGRSDGTPDYVVDKMNRLLLLNNVWMDDLQITREKDSKFEPIITPGVLKKFWSIDIREAKAISGSVINTVTDGAGIKIVYNMNNSAFGANINADPNLIQITQINS